MLAKTSYSATKTDKVNPSANIMRQFFQTCRYQLIVFSVQLNILGKNSSAFFQADTKKAMHRLNTKRARCSKFAMGLLAAKDQLMAWLQRKEHTWHSHWNAQWQNEASLRLALHRWSNPTCRLSQSTDEPSEKNSPTDCPKNRFLGT